MEAAKDELSTLKGPEFDRAFANRMSMGHKRVISMVQAWRQDCRDQDVCNLIDTLLPQLQKHAQTADSSRGRPPWAGRGKIGNRRKRPGPRGVANALRVCFGPPPQRVRVLR